jgi:hypothetical protein
MHVALQELFLFFSIKHSLFYLIVCGDLSILLIYLAFLNKDQSFGLQEEGLILLSGMG